jgi:uncharacterized protein YbjQ (UPF0145 family)
MSMPWNPHYRPPAIDNDLVGEVTGMIEGAINTGTQVATDIGSGVATQIGGAAAGQAVHDAGQIAQDVETAAENLGAAVIPGVSAPTVQVSTGGTGQVSDGSTGQVGGPWSEVLGNAAKNSIKGTINAVLPMVEDRIAHEAEKILSQELAKALGGTDAPMATLPKSDLKKFDAWERAARTFFIGILVTALGAVVTVIGQLSTSGTHIDFFHKEGWMAVGTLAVGAVVTAVGSYIGRYLKEPDGARIDSSKPL